MQNRFRLLLLVFSVFIMLTACAKIENIEDDIVGTWRFNQVDYTSDIIRATCPECSANLTDDYAGQKLEFNDDKTFNHLDANDSTLFAGNWEVEEVATNYFDRFGEVRVSGYTLRLNVADPPEPGDLLLRNTSKKKLDVMRIDTAGTFYMILKPN